MERSAVAADASHAAQAPLEVLTIGRCGVDIYPLQSGCGLEDVQTFGKFLGGSPTNVAVAAAKLKRRSAVVTAVGDDPFGRYVRQEMRAAGVYDTFVGVNPKLATPVTFCEIFPPDSFPLYFYRQPSAPDLQITPADIPRRAVRQARIFWVSATGLSAQPSFDAHLHALRLRDGDRAAKLGGREPAGTGAASSAPTSAASSRRWTIADLDYRPAFWADEGEAHRRIDAILDHVNVAVGNLQECRVAVGEDDPDRAADALLERGLEIAIVKQGPRGTLCKTSSQRIRVPVTKVDIVNGLGAGDAFGGALCHGLLAGWPLPRVIAAASTAGAIVCSRLECSTAMPTESQILRVMEAHPHSAPVVTTRGDSA